MIAWSELKERKLVQWAVAYVAGAWALLEVVGLLSDTYAWPPALMRALPVLLLVGFFGALVLAWFHGEKGAQKASATEIGMLAALLVVAGAAIAWTRGPTMGAAGAAPDPAAHAAATSVAAMTTGAEQGSIAVLPFVNMSSDPEQEFFSDGISEELLKVLAQLPELRVASRTSAFAFKGTAVGIDSIARALNVRHVLEGSVRKAGDRVRITAQLIDATTGYHLWSESYDRELTDIFAVQDEISREIVDELQIELSGGRDGVPLAKIATTDAEAHTLVLRARELSLRSRGDPAVFLPRAERLFEEAIGRDSSYAAAWAGLANVLRIQAQFGLIPPAEGYERAWAAAERALALDPDEGDAHLVMGAVLSVTGDPSAVGEHYERAFRSNPGDPRTLSFYAGWLMGEGRQDEAERLTRRAVELDPLSVAALSNAGHTYLRLGDLAAAAAMYDRALALSETPFTLGDMAWVRILAGEREEALRLVERTLAIASQSFTEVSRAAWIHAYARDFPRAIELFRRAIELEPHNPAGPAYLGNVLAAVGRGEEAVRHAERAVEMDPDHESARVIRAYVYAAAGRRAAARRALEDLAPDDFLARAAVHAALGENDRAFALLDLAVENRTSGVVEMGADWWFDNLRGDPRMDRLLAEVGMPDVARRQ